MVRDQLEQTTQMEDELCLYILALDKMRTQMKQQVNAAQTLSTELGELGAKHEKQSNELTLARRDAKKANKAKQRLQTLADKQLTLVKAETEQANKMHDKLAAVLKAKAKQQATFEEYKRLVESMKLEKLDLKREYRTSRRGPRGVANGRFG